jgi:hypothetical protein
VTILLNVISLNAQKVVVCDWEIIDFPSNDAQKVTEMFRLELMRRFDVPSLKQMQTKLDTENIILPIHLEKRDLERLGELFQSDKIVTGLITRMDNQFTINVRLITLPTGDTLTSITQDINGALLEPSKTIIPEIVKEIEKYLPSQKLKKKNKWSLVKIFGLGSLAGGAVLSYFIWFDKKEETKPPTEEKLPRPPKFPDN